MRVRFPENGYLLKLFTGYWKLHAPGLTVFHFSPEKDIANFFAALVFDLSLILRRPILFLRLFVPGGQVLCAFLWLVQRAWPVVTFLTLIVSPQGTTLPVVNGPEIFAALYSAHWNRSLRRHGLHHLTPQKHSGRPTVFLLSRKQ